MKYYDKINNRLVFVQKQASQNFWENHWAKHNVEKLIKNASSSRVILCNTRKYLRVGARILEGGCGPGQYVNCLHVNGYESYGLDYATETLKSIHQIKPELRVLSGDVNALPFKNSFFDGYWSFGVIEHFYNGYNGIALEMKRVLKRGGYLFLAVPVMSWLRRKKAIKGKYLNYNETIDAKEEFYQFALDPKRVIKEFEEKNFILKRTVKVDGVKGLKGEISLFKRPLQWIYDCQILPVKIIRKIIDILAKPFANHVMLFIFKSQ